MADAAELALEGVPVIVDNYEKVYDPVKDKAKQGVQKVKEMRDNRRSNGRGGYESDSESEEYERGPARPRSGGGRRSPPYESHRRSNNGDYVEERYAYRGPPRASSQGRYGGRGSDRRDSRRDYSDSESSISPRPRRRRKSLGERALVALGLGGAAGAAADKERDRRRSKSRDRRSRNRNRSVSSSGSSNSRYRGGQSLSRARTYGDDRTPSQYKPGYAKSGGGQSDYSNNQVARRDGGSQVARQKKKDSNSGSSSASESSEVCSSSEDERRTRKMKGKEYLTAGLAAVATIHAAHSVYNSMEARDKRHEQVAKGEMSPEESRKLKHKARIQDAASIGIAALGIKGAYSEWKEVQENRNELAEQQKSRQERHEKRVRKAQKYGNGGNRNRSEPDMGRRRRDDRDY